MASATEVYRTHPTDDEIAAVLEQREIATLGTDQALEGLHRAWSRIDDVSIEITPTRTRSWTNTLLRREAEAELGASYGTAWRDDD